uniref:Uncharacterized protein n=1 Tax=Panagrolaimus sp. JU765 TaxID=591449 RepID=A0AC34QCD6_9BILA
MIHFLLRSIFVGYVWCQTEHYFDFSFTTKDDGTIDERVMSKSVIFAAISFIGICFIILPSFLTSCYLSRQEFVLPNVGDVIGPNNNHAYEPDNYLEPINRNVGGIVDELDDEIPNEIV